MLRIAFGVSIIAQSLVASASENLVERVRGFDDVARRIDLGQQDAVGCERAGKLQIVRAPFARNRVDADDDLRPAGSALFHESGELFARGRLLGGGDRVLQIEDHRVAARARRSWPKPARSRREHRARNGAGDGWRAAWRFHASRLAAAQPLAGLA